jgi:hypothetical protein
VRRFGAILVQLELMTQLYIHPCDLKKELYSDYLSSSRRSLKEK